jgi:glycosyltransferase involved in cell wall biosynthesis
MNKIRVVHIIPLMTPGGAERVAIQIVSGLNRQRYEPVLVSLMGRRNCIVDRELDESGVEVRYLGKHLGFDYRMFSQVHGVLKDCRADIVHTHLQVLRYVFPAAAFLKQALVVHTVHNLAEREIEPGMRWLQGYALQHGVVPVAVAEEVALSLEKVYGVPKCRVIPNGIPTGSYTGSTMPRWEWRAREGFSESDLLFVCVARLAPQKNHALLLNGFAGGPAADRKAHLLLVGDGALRKRLESQVEALGLSRQVHFLGLRADIPEILRASDVFVLSSDFEGNPLCVMEAMAAGLPIVSTAVGGVPALLESDKQGLLVPPGDRQGLSKAMMALLQNQEARNSWGRAAMRRAKERFDVSTMVQAYEEVYEQILGGSRPLKAENSFGESAMPIEQAAESFVRRIPAANRMHRD